MEIFRVTFIGHREQNNISYIEDEIEKKARKGGIEIINLATRDYKKTDFCD